MCPGTLILYDPATEGCADPTCIPKLRDGMIALSKSQGRALRPLGSAMSVVSPLGEGIGCVFAPKRDQNEEQRHFEERKWVAATRVVVGEIRGS